MSLRIKNIKPEFKDERGFISRIINDEGYKISSVLYIERKKGTRGADHYHKKDAHYVYVLKGKVRRSEKDMTKKNSRIKSAILKPGDIILTLPMTAHSDEFLENSILLAFTTKKRNQKDYEKDTVRVGFFKDGSK